MFKNLVVEKKQKKAISFDFERNLNLIAILPFIACLVD